jgi:hypothetical protein
MEGLDQSLQRLAVLLESQLKEQRRTNELLATRDRSDRG